MQFDPVGVFAEAGHPVVEANDIGVGLPGAGGEDLVQVSAMKLRVRSAVQLLLRQRKSLDHLAGVVEPEHVGLGLDADRQQAVLDAEVPHDMHGIGADLDAGADFAKLRRLLVDLDRMAGLHQAGCGGQAAKTCTGNEDAILLHFQQPPEGFRLGPYHSGAPC